jgi:hypothetical protein
MCVTVCLCAVGTYKYDCPGESLLDVSWHITANPVSGPLNKFLMEPNIKDAVMVSKAAFILSRT